MPVVSELIRIEDDGTISFGNYMLAAKSNQLEDEREYEVYVDGVSVGGMKTNVSGKLVLSVELNPGKATAIRIEAR